jgi:hypothetical protein
MLNKLALTAAPSVTDAAYTYYNKFSFPTISGLPAGSTIYWRPRIETAHGMYWGQTQSFTTPTPPPIFYPCRFTRCR